MGTFVGDPRDTQQDGSALHCPRCSRRLSPMSGSDILRFICDLGHEVEGEELLSSHSLSVLAEVEELLHAWERRLAQLESTANAARRRGHVDVAAIFQRQIDAARARVRSIRAAMAKARP